MSAPFEVDLLPQRKASDASDNNDNNVDYLNLPLIMYLPNELLTHAFSFVPVRDVLLNVCLVCSDWSILCNSSILWRHYCILHHGHEAIEAAAAVLIADKKIDWKTQFRSGLLTWDMKEHGTNVIIDPRGKKAKYQSTYLRKATWRGGGVRLNRGWSEGCHHWEISTGPSENITLGVVDSTLKLSDPQLEPLFGCKQVEIFHAFSGRFYGITGKTNAFRRAAEATIGVRLTFHEENETATLTIFHGMMFECTFPIAAGTVLHPLVDLGDRDATATILHYRRIK